VEDLSDNERAEQLRQWWSENWLWIVGGIALGLAALAGYQYWQQTRFKASEDDERVTWRCWIRSVRTSSKRRRSRRTRCVRCTRKSPYADQADLALARASAESRDFDTAAKRLRAVVDGSRDPQLG
jgi:predicted negative regulator of RcsB-dependent stress response